MTKLISRKVGVPYIEDAKFPGIYGALWNDGSGNITKLMLVRLTDMDTSDDEDSTTKYMWVKNTMCFFHIGRFSTLRHALSPETVEEVFSFETFSEFSEWFEN